MNDNELRDLTDSELEQVNGGADKTGNWKHCAYGTKAGGGPGLYPWYVECKAQ
jgi:hypothetical protein